MNKDPFAPAPARRNIPFISYLIRTWPLLLATLAFNVLIRWNHAFMWIPNGHDEWGFTVWQGLTAADLGGAYLTLPAGVSAMFWLLGLVIHLYHRQTLERDAHTGRTGRDWDALSPAERIKWATYQRIGYVLAIGLVVAALVK